MAQPRLAGRSRPTLAVLVLLSVTLITLDSRGWGPVDSLRRTTMDLLAPVADTADRVLAPARDAISGISGYDDLRRENVRLRDELQELRSAQLAVDGVRAQNEALRGLLDLPGLAAIPMVAAEVTTRPTSNVDQTIEINRGSGAGIEVGMPVVAGGSLLVGRVVEVSGSRARVRLLTDPAFSAGVSLPEVPEIGVASGAGADRPLEVSLVDDPATRPGVIVVTSGERSLLPKDLIVGTVTEAVQIEGELSLRVRVEPAVDLTRLEFVAVLLWKPAE